jgi:hypothetical protein
MHPNPQPALSPTQLRLGAVWIFVVLNYLYCDLLGLMDSHLLRQYLAGEVGGIEVSQGFLLASSALMEIPMAAIPAALLLSGPIGRTVQLAAGSVMTVVQAASLTFGEATVYYLFFSVVEIGGTAAVVVIAWRWRPARVPGPAAV